MIYRSRLMALVVLFSVISAGVVLGAGGIVVDHKSTDVSSIPDSWVTEARRVLRVGYGHTSHGSQLVSGMQAFRGKKASFYYFTMSDWGLVPHIFLNDYWGNAGGASDLGQNGDLGWRDASVQMLDLPQSDRNVVLWSWCGGVSDNTKDGIDTYLSAMNDLEQSYPGVHFVYMTGHLDGTGAKGNLNTRNEQIRKYCKQRGKTLFDFADIESYDPDGMVNYMKKYATDGCEYDSNNDGNPWGDRNWADDWVSRNPEHALSRLAGACGDCAHSHTLNCVMKGRAVWWMLARLAGWPGPSKNLKVMAPNGGEAWRIGETRSITWQAAGLSGNAKLVLIKDNTTVVGTIAPNVALGSRAFSWNVGRLQTGSAAAGTGYTIKIQTADGKMADVSNKGFRLSQ